MRTIAALVIAKILTDTSAQTGIYYDEGGQAMLGSTLARDPMFQDRVVAETRALLSAIRESTILHQASPPESVSDVRNLHPEFLDAAR